MKKLMMIAALVVAQNSNAQEERPCYAEVQNAAAVEAANVFGALVQDVRVAHFEATPENTNGNIDVQISMYQGKKLHHMMVKVRAANCGVRSVKPLDASKIDALALQAMRYKQAIKDTEWYSESEAEWVTFYTAIDAPAVSANFSKASIRAALNIDVETPIEVYSAADAIKFIEVDPQDENIEHKDKYNYGKLKEEMLKDFTSLRAIKVGRPDSGALYIYIFGRTSDGRLVGVQTITVET